MAIVLTPEQEELVNEQIARGQFASAREVLDAALHLFQIQSHDDPLPLEELRREIALGDADFERGEYTPHDSASLRARLEEIKAEGRERLAAQPKATS